MSTLTVAHRKQDGAPWYGLPAARNDSSVTPTELMNSAGLLGWDVRKREIVTDATPVAGADYEVLADIAGHHVRLGIAGERYHTVQNEELATLADSIADGDVTMDTAGYYRGGRNIFMVFTLGENIVLDPEGQADSIGRFLTITSSHDGTTGICAVTNNMRIACQNMLTANRASALSTFKMRHTASVQGRILQARKALGIAFKASETFEQEMRALMDVSLTDGQFWDIVEKVYPRPEHDVKGSVKKWESKTDTIMGLWNGETLSGLDNTGYKAYNALNEHLMWYSSVRAGNVENALVKASGLDDATNRANLGLYKAVLLAV